MKNDAFSGFHPVVNFIFFVAALGLTMFIQQPVYLLISLISGCAYLLYLQGKKGFFRQVGYLAPILVMMAIMNPMFNHEGVTVLWYLPNDNPITLEAICFGLASAVMMGASIADIHFEASHAASSSASTRVPTFAKFLLLHAVRQMTIITKVMPNERR